MNNGAHVDVWDLLERSVERTPAANPGSPETTDDTPAATSERKFVWRRRFLDTTAIAAWVYGFLALFVVDPVRAFLDAVAPEVSWLADYRFVVVLALLVWVSIFRWKWFTLGVATYVVTFPLVVLLWKLPRRVFRRKSWTPVMVAVNALALVLRNLRYNVISKSLLVLFAGAILVTESRPVLLASGAGLLVLLGWATARTLRRTFERNWFFRYQESAIDALVGSSFFKNFTTSEVQKVLSTPRDTLNSNEVAQISTGISMWIIANRAIYFWAYRLREYKQARLTAVFNLASYAWLFLGSASAFGFVNLALYKADPAFYSYGSRPSSLAMIVYGVSTMALNDGAGVTSASALAHILRLAAGLFGVLFLAVVAGDLVLTWRRERDEDALDATVEAFKSRARQQEENLRGLVNVGVDEARRRLQDLGLGLAGVVAYFTSSMPDDFYD